MFKAGFLICLVGVVGLFISSLVDQASSTWTTPVTFIEQEFVTELAYPDVYLCPPLPQTRAPGRPAPIPRVRPIAPQAWADSLSTGTPLTTLPRTSSIWARKRITTERAGCPSNLSSTLPTVSSRLPRRQTRAKSLRASAATNGKRVRSPKRPTQRSQPVPSTRPRGLRASSAGSSPSNRRTDQVESRNIDCCCRGPLPVRDAPNGGRREREFRKDYDDLLWQGRGLVQEH